MPYKKYPVRPMDGGYSSEYSNLHSRPGSIIWPAKNIRIEQHSIQKRWGYTEDRDLGTGVDVLGITIYQEKDTTRNTMYLGDADLCLKVTGGSNTFAYKTETYTTGLVTGISSDVVTGDGDCDWVTADIVAGDKFIITADDSANIEPDVHWATIEKIDSETQITLTANYAGSGTSGAYKIRQVYTTPTDERWQWAVVNNIFCFTNGNVNTQKWAALTDTYASALDVTYAIKARYCIEYANRLILADLGTTRDPLLIQWSKEGDPTNWTDSTSGGAQLLETTDYITGLGKVGASLIVYKRDSIIIGSRTGVATSPIVFPTQRRGVGCIAPYSIIEGISTNAFLGRDDFYLLVGDYPVSIGKDIRDFFFEIVTLANAEKTFGFPVESKNEFIWVATTTEGQLAFVYNTRSKQWYVYDFNDTLKCGGRGAV